MLCEKRNLRYTFHIRRIETATRGRTTEGSVDEALHIMRILTDHGCTRPGITTIPQPRAGSRKPAWKMRKSSKDS
jgi:hypothetical protein